MTDTTQPPAETLAEAREIAALFYDKRDPLDAACRDIAHNIRRGRCDHQDAVELVRFTMAYLATLTRRAGGDASCKAAPDHADIMETIQNAADDWQKKGYATALAEVRDMANVGRALMEALPEGYSYNDCPSEIVSDLQNERDEAVARAGGDAIPEGWQSIETAPRDGTWFIADGGGLDRPTPIKWCARVGAWEADAVMLEDWDDQAEGYSRPLFWWAIPERRPATPKAFAIEGVGATHTPNSYVLLEPDAEDVRLLARGALAGCPCCGGTPSTFARLFPHSGIYQAYVNCSRCHVQVLSNARDRAEAREQAIAAWSKRPVQAGGDAIPAGDASAEEAAECWLDENVAPGHSRDRDYSADDMIDAFIAGRESATPKPPVGGDAGARELLDEAIEHIGLLVSVDPGPKANAVFAAARAWFERQDAALALPAPVVEGDFPREKIARLCLSALYGFEFTGDSLCDEADRIFSPPNVRVAKAVALADAIDAALSEGRSHG